MAAARVSAYDSRGFSAGLGQLAPDGLYHLRGLAPGSHILVVSADGLGATVTGALAVPRPEAEIEVLLKRASGGLAGRILDTVSGLGLPSASVRVLRIVEIARVDTDTSGGFELIDLEPGEYTLVVQAEGYGHACQGFYLGAGGTVRLEIALWPGSGEIRGAVLDGTTMQPLPEAIVQVILAGQAILTAIANPLGRFILPAIAPGRLLLAARARGYASSIQSVAVRRSGITEVSLIVWPFQGRLSGKVCDSHTGEPLAGALISAHDSLAAPAIWAISDRRGLYQLPELREDTYLVSARAAGYQTIQAGAAVVVEEETLLDLDLTPGGGVIEGSVTAVERPVAGGIVTVFNQDDLAFATVLTDADGAYTCRGLQPGSYNVIATARGCFTGKIGATVAAGRKSPASIDLVRGEGGIAGEVGTNGPLLCATVTAYTLRGLATATDWIDADGRFDLAGLVPGSYRLSVHAPAYPTATMEADSPQNPSSVIRLHLGNTQATLAGVVRSGGRPLIGVAVRAYSPVGEPPDQALTDSAGRYLLVGLPGGKTWLVYSAHGYITATALFEQEPGDYAERDIVLNSPPLQVLAVIRDADARPLPGIEVRFCDCAGRYLFTLLTNEEGFYSLRAWAPRETPWFIEPSSSP